MVPPPDRYEIGAADRSTVSASGSRSPGPRRRNVLPAVERLDLANHRRRSFRRFVRAGRKTMQGRQRQRQCEAARCRDRPRPWRRNEIRSIAAPIAASGSSQSGVSWSTNVSTTAAAAAPSGGGACDAGHAGDPPRMGHGVEHRAKASLGFGNRIGEAGLQALAHDRMFRMAKNSTRVAAAFSARV